MVERRQRAADTLVGSLQERLGRLGLVPDDRLVVEGNNNSQIVDFEFVLQHQL
jgi:hypothetical protein